VGDWAQICANSLAGTLIGRFTSQKQQSERLHRATALVVAQTRRSSRVTRQAARRGERAAVSRPATITAGHGGHSWLSSDGCRCPLQDTCAWQPLLPHTHHTPANATTAAHVCARACVLCVCACVCVRAGCVLSTSGRPRWTRRTARTAGTTARASWPTSSASTARPSWACRCARGRRWHARGGGAAGGQLASWPVRLWAGAAAEAPSRAAISCPPRCRAPRLGRAAGAAQAPGGVSGGAAAGVRLGRLGPLPRGVWPGRGGAGACVCGRMCVCVWGGG
jgi:hypothetical protein